MSQRRRRAGGVEPAVGGRLTVPPAPGLRPRMSVAERAELLAAGREAFDAGRYFAAHEHWETVWRSDRPEPRSLLQALIQTAAALHNATERGHRAAAARTLDKASRRLESAGTETLGIDLPVLRARVNRWQATLAAGEPVEGEVLLPLRDPQVFR